MVSKDFIVRGFKYCLVALFAYFVLKAPIMVLFTDYLHIHYVIGGALSGIVVTVLSFLIYDPISRKQGWLWKRKQQ